MKTIIEDGHTLVLRALRKLIGTETGWTVADGGLHFVLEEIASRDWASATFAGQVHRIGCRLEGEAEAVESAVARIEAELPHADLATNRQFIAEAAVVEASVTASASVTVARLDVEALTLEA